MKLAIWSTTTPRENSTHQEMFRRQLEEVELAERIGIDQIWFFEHHLSRRRRCPRPICLSPPRHSHEPHPLRQHGQHPAVPASAAGRRGGGDARQSDQWAADMGLGRGLRPPEFEAFGIDQQQSREMFLEIFDIIRRVWADENFAYRGKYWTVRQECDRCRRRLCSDRTRRSWSAPRARNRCAGRRDTTSRSRRSI